MSEPATDRMPASWAGWARVRVQPGTGVVDRRGDTLLVVPEAPESQHEQVRQLLDLCHGPEPTDGGRLQAAKALLGGRGPGEVPGFALLVRSRTALQALVTGSVRVVVDGRVTDSLTAPGDGDTAAGDTAAGERVLDDGTWQQLVVTAGEPPVGEVPGGLPFDLETGTVPGAGVTLVRVSVPPVTAPQQRAGDAAAAGPAPRETSFTTLRPALQFRSVLLGQCALAAGEHDGSSRRRPPLPVQGGRAEGRPDAPRPDVEVLVDGVLCGQGHFVDPDSRTCPSCGETISPEEARVRMPRPPLGILVTDGGTIYTVTGDYVIGREAERSPDVEAGRARPLPLRDAARSTSRIHARLTVSGWKVLITDDYSANGTFISRHGASGPWRRLPPQVPVALAHGDRVRLGKRQLLFDAWREPMVPRVLR